MFDDELEPRKKEGFSARNLENMSVSELQEYIAELKAEIDRAESDIAKKKAHEEAVSGLFKS